MIIKRMTGRQPILFRPPFGARWFSLAEVQYRLGLVSVLWTTMGNDWMWPADLVAGRVLRTVHSGSIICLHDVLRLKSDRKSTRLNSSHQIISYAVFCLKKKRSN